MTLNEDAQPKAQSSEEISVLSQVLALLQGLESGARQRILETCATYFGIGGGSAKAFASSGGSATGGTATVSFSEDRSASPKDFMLEKQPQSDVERVACLAFYLTHYRDMRFFKNLDISKLNTDAAQIKFSNAAYSVANAEKAGLLTPAQRGQKQLSAIGEQFVLALPDREAAKSVLTRMRKRRRVRKNAQGQPDEGNGEESVNNADADQGT